MPPTASLAAAPLTLTGVEIASGIVCGPGPAMAPPQAGALLDPLAALQAAVLGPLRRAPCLVSFSGGIDSSVVLATATGVARREGLPDPVPITWRFADDAKADETAWQEGVIAELGLGDWIRLEGRGELEFVGDVALGAAARHGLLYPANAFLHLPLLERAAGGSLLTGVGGDEILGRWRGRFAADARAQRRPAVAGDRLRRAFAATPRPVRALRIVRRDPCGPLPWLRPAVARRVALAEAFERAGDPARWDRRVLWQATRRRLALSLRSLELLAADAGALVASPLLAPTFLRALSNAGGRDGFGNRMATLEATLGAVLPASVRGRRTKATFGDVFFADETRRFLGQWNGLGIDGDHVDPDALRAAWRGSQPSLLTALLMQQAALAARPPISRGERRP